jgi:hypothetical protein
VASFTNEDQIVASFARLLDEPVQISIKKCHVIAIVFGFSQFIQYFIFATLYYMGAVFQKHYFDDNPFDVLSVKTYSEHIFISIFSMMFGAMAAGQA